MTGRRAPGYTDKPMKRSGKKRQPPVPHDEFVLVFQTSKTLSEVAEVLGMRAAAVSVRASRMRKRGVKLKRFQHPMHGASLKLLNKLAGRKRR